MKRVIGLGCFMIKRIVKYCILLAYNHYLSRKTNSKILPGADLRGTILHGNNEIGGNTQISNSIMGFASYIGDNCILPNCIIGNYCSISWNVRLIAGNHPTRDYVSTHPLFYSNRVFSGLNFLDKTIFPEFSYADEQKQKFVIIGNDVWIGADVLLLNGIVVGDGAIIGAGTIVTKDVPDYAVLVGNPAKIIRYRFSEEQIKYLKKYKWWKKDVGWLKTNSALFQNINNFISETESE